MNINPEFVQVNYDRVLSQGLPGSNADANPTYDNCFIAAADVAYGIVISNQSVGQFPVIGKAGISNVTATAGYASGLSPILVDINEWKKITDGSFKLYVDGAEVSVTTVTFAAATSLADVASTIQTKLRAATSSTETVAYVGGAFKITSATTGVTSTIGPMLPNTTGTSLVDKLGFTQYDAVSGTAAITAAALGVVIRSVVDQANPAPNSNITTVKVGDVGAYRLDGKIKVMAKEAVTAGSTVYFDTTTGELYGSSSGTHTNALGTSKWLTNTSAGAVGIIDIRGLR